MNELPMEGLSADQLQQLQDLQALQTADMTGWGALFAGFGLILFILIIWSAVWKAIALWKAARNGHKGWYIALFIINTIGILEIIYILMYRDKQGKIPEKK